MREPTIQDVLNKLNTLEKKIMEHKVDTALELVYQATGSVSGLTDVTLVTYDETHALDGTGFPDVILTEVGTTGKYYAAITPDAIGEWQFHIDSVTNPGKLVKHVTVVARDVDSVGDDVAAVGGQVTASESNVRGADADTLKTLSDQIDGISHVSAPMIG